MAEDSFEVNLDWMKKYFLKNKFVLIFSLLTFFSLILWVSSSAGFSLKISFLVQFASLFPPILWLFLTISLLASSILAYYEKYSLMFLPIMIWLLLTTAIVRTSNMPDLVNAATGEPVLGPDLDPFLFLRNAIEISQGKNMGPLDEMRYAPLGASSYIKGNMMPWAILGVYKMLDLIGNFSVTQSAIISPVIFFLISLIGFFFFVKVLFSFKFSKNKALAGATIASIFYAFIPAMVHRTIAGIPELESLGMIWFWFAFLFFALAWKKNLMEDEKKFVFKNKKMILYGLLTGLFTGLMSWTWGGYRYIYMVLAFAVFLAFLFNIEKKKNILIFGSFVFAGLLIEIIKVKNIFLIVTNFNDIGFALGVFLIMIVNYLFFETKFKNNSLLIRIKEKTKLPENVLSILFFVLFGMLLLLIFNPTLIYDLFSRTLLGLLEPFGKGRIALTVSENRAPYFTEVLSTFGGLVWMFLAGIVLVFFNVTKHFEKKNKTILNSFFVIFVLTFVFSRISPSGLLNGETFISKFLYIGGLILFAFVLLFIYLRSYIKKEEKTLTDFSKINFASLILISFSFWGIVSMRGAVRLFFIIAPIIILVAIYFFVKVTDHLKSKDDLVKMFAWLIILGSIFILLTAFMSHAGSTVAISHQTIPSSYNQQWHYAMNWVSENTPENSIFVHWWDYGYWVQTLGGRPTVTDGGHYISWWDHTTARYLLTTSKPETALSLMKTHNVSYLLIDSTDVGKYSAFSKIGSDETGKDRFSWIPVMPLDESQTRESNNKTRIVYMGGQAIDSDIIYELNETPIFLPAEKAGLVGIIVEYSLKEKDITFSQPIGVFIYNSQRYDLPLRYIFYNDDLIDFGNGINSTTRFIPGLDQGSKGVSINPLGATIYLSEKTKDTLFAQLYLMDDPNNLYPDIALVHTEEDVVVKSLKQQGLDFGNFLYYQGLRGPIKIWEVNPSEKIIERGEFLWNIDPNGNWASLDDLQFTN
ncbi:hypothetical protein COU58_02420 [Candidatus Pacearchaeota archaeon CG10_big_fil_rev_8_21_14_0_10_32_42]|nr:MAG: hypothetical protein COU58_02420 [Candidatus Pacearchaeota archaeon CG10_big_fil_rev_8_21_14_0_10_32_42]